MGNLFRVFEIESKADSGQGCAVIAPKHYRPEIDGLRAVSVIGVVLFHFGMGFPGGFVGVDVFFVISGYLITGILLRQLSEDRFSLVDFWARRIRRIAPAAIVMVLGTLLIGGYLQTPERYSSLARSAMAHIAMASNCYFTRDQGYFAEKSDLEPLLHTWSLSVEEQFYMLFPLMIWLIWSRWRSKLAWILGTVALASFVWSYLEVPRDPKEAFFLLPARAWELLVGSLLAIAPQCGMKAARREVASAIGLLLVMAPMFFYHRETDFPGMTALPPVLGAGLFIYAGGATRIGSLLSWKPMVAIGLISYSLYLWHWPLVVFVRELGFELTPAWQISLLSASFLLGYLSWRWVETPFRTGAFLGTNSRALKFGALSACALFALVFTIRSSGGFPSRLPEDLRIIMDDIEWNGARYTSADSRPVPIGVEDDRIDFVLWGDSHGASAAPAIDHTARALGLRGRAYLNNGTPPVTGLWFADMEEENADEMTALNERVLDEIIASKPKQLILIGRWVARCEGYNEVEMEGQPNALRFTTMVVDSTNPEPEFTDSSSALRRQLIGMNLKLKEAGIEMVLVQQVPESTMGRTAARFFTRSRFPGLYDFPQFTTTLADHGERQKRTMESLSRLSEEGITIVDPTNQFFKDHDELKVYADRSYYRDEDHLTRAGSIHYLVPVFEKIMRRIPPAESQ